MFNLLKIEIHKSMNIDFKNVSKHYAARSHEKMQEVLMDPNGIGPAIHYYMIRGGKEQKNITVWEPGTIGTEYIKTYGHYHVGKLDETYWIIFGTGVALLQKLAVDEKGQMIPDVVEEFKALPVKQGDEVYMPTGYGHLVVNTGTTYFVTADDSPVDFEERDPVSFKYLTIDSRIESFWLSGKSVTNVVSLREIRRRRKVWLF